MINPESILSSADKMILKTLFSLFRVTYANISDEDKFSDIIDLFITESQPKVHITVAGRRQLQRDIRVLLVKIYGDKNG